ncbi:MAG: hypothetical protein ACXVPN_11035 [Bacteroidia bacterium]
MTFRSFLNHHYLLLFFLISYSSLRAQWDKKEILRNYASSDTMQNNKEARLILYKDNSFINYSIYCNPKEREWYIWYTKGKWNGSSERITLNSEDPMPNSEQLILFIKNSFKHRKDYKLINHYEFVSIGYTDIVYNLITNKVVDPIRKVEYFEITK